MLLKKADDKSKRVAMLEDLQRSPALDAGQKKWLREELVRLRKGIQGEQDSAYYLDQYYKDAQNNVVLHDLRLSVDGDVAQIDHLVINRVSGFILLETKNYAGDVVINAQGEFMAVYGDDRFGVASPIEQSRRHERVLQRLLRRLEITTRTGGDHECHHVVMFHPKAVITRPSPKAFDTGNVIKADQFPSWHASFVERDVGFGNALRAVANLRSPETIREWGEKLMRQHRPANLLELPEFMQPRRVVTAAPVRAVVPPPVVPPPAAVPASEPEAALAEPGQKKLICLHCNAKISYPEGKFCWNNPARFGGGQYCREHQALFPQGEVQ